MTSHDGNDSNVARAVLWTVQGLLAMLFLFAGGSKLVLPAAALTQAAPIPAVFLRFIGVCEVLGALGLLLPGLLHVHEELTRLAAGGLVIIMSGAVGATLATGVVKMALIPLVVGLLAALVAVARGSERVLAHASNDDEARRPDDGGHRPARRGAGW